MTNWKTIFVGQGISSFANTASRLAVKATENATKLGSIATQKVSELSETVNEKVKEGTIVNELQSQVTNIGSKVFDVSKRGISDLSSIFGQKTSLYEDPNRSEAFADHQATDYQSYQNFDEAATGTIKLDPTSKSIRQESMHSSKSTPANLSGQTISKEEQVLGKGLNARSIKKKTEEDEVWSILANDDKPKRSTRRK